MVNDFLFELGCEELPSATVWPLAKELSSHLLKALDKAELHYGKVHCFATSRRVAILISQLQEEQPFQKLMRRGPTLASAYDSQGKPTPAVLGFAKSCGISLQELSIQKTEKGEWLVYETQSQGEKTENLLPTIISHALKELSLAKPMRWGEGNIEFVRPIHWALLLYGTKVIPCEILGVQTGRSTYGHRFHSPKALKIEKPQDYEALLEKAFVIADFAKRRKLITEQIKKLAASFDAQAIMPDNLLDEVTSIVEWPQAHLANFETKFLQVPPEALIASMQAHQKCFALKDKSGQLLPHFITVSNITSVNPKQVIAGNEKVMRARLSDAAFFYQQDKKEPLSHRIPLTDKVLFQDKLGSLRDKAYRLQELMDFLSGPLHLDKQQASRAAQLSKCDLLTGMVGEFPELQGLMGYYYAQQDGETEAVARALNEQYMPRFAADELPASPLGLALSLADRIDSLVGIFALGQKPSGDKDPFKLRRHALAIVRLLIATEAKLPLSLLINETNSIYGDKLPPNRPGISQLQTFILERLQSYYLAQQINLDLFQAVVVCQKDWLYDFDKRIRALSEFVLLPEAFALSAACKRVHNLLQQATHSLKDNVVDASLLREEAELDLYKALCAMEAQVKTLYEQLDYKTLLTQLAGLGKSVDKFFDQVMVMVEEEGIRTNRLRLLARLQELLKGVADISLLQLNQ